MFLTSFSLVLGGQSIVVMSPVPAGSHLKWAKSQRMQILCILQVLLKMS